jgi:hypothetical protein
MSTKINLFLAAGCLFCIGAFGAASAIEIKTEDSTVTTSASEIEATRLPSGIIARVNGVEITKKQLDAEVAKAAPLALGNVTNEFIAAIKSQMIAKELIRQEAYRQKLENDPEVKEAVRYAESIAMIQIYVEKNTKVNEVAEEEIRGQYNALLSQLGDFEYKIRLIETDNFGIATVIESELSKGMDFREAASRYSAKGKHNNNNGEMPWISFKNPPQKGKTQGIPLLVTHALLNLSVGEFTAKPITDNGKFIFVRLEAMRPVQIPTYEEAKPAIKKALESKYAREASLKMVEELMNRATIEQ